MKKHILLTATFAALIALSVQATTWTVSNNTNSPGQYTSLQAAINAAAIGDTLLVAGSPTSYGDVTINKQLVLIGAGYHNIFGSNSTIGVLNLFRQNLYISASGSKIMGFNFTGLIDFCGTFSGGTTVSQTIDNVVFERCQISSLSFGGNTGTYVAETFKYDTIRNCLITGQIGTYILIPPYTDYFNYIIIHNNVFSGAYFSFGRNYSSYGNMYADLNKFYVKNNLFLNRVSNCFDFFLNAVLENNIFYAAEPQGGTNCAFTKNITYMCLNNTIPGSGNIGGGNLVNIDPQFINFPLAGGAFSYSYDFHLKPSSPGKNAGTDGTDIGIYGGMMPFEVGANPYIPQMMELTLPGGSSVPAGGTLNVHFKAKKQN